VSQPPQSQPGGTRKRKQGCILVLNKDMWEKVATLSECAAG